MKNKILFFLIIALISFSNVFAQVKSSNIYHSPPPDFTNSWLTTLPKCYNHYDSLYSRSWDSIYKKRLDSIFNNASYIFEGKIIPIDIKGFITKDGNKYANYLFEIKKVYRGGEKLKAGTVEILSRMSHGYEDYYSGPQFRGGTMLLACRDISIPGINSTSDSLKVELFYSYNNEGGKIYYHSYISSTTLSGVQDGSMRYYEGMHLNFKTLQDAGAFIQNRYGLSAADPLPNPKPQLKSIAPPPAKSEYYKPPEEIKTLLQETAKQKAYIDSLIHQ